MTNGFSEHDLRRALAGHAATVDPRIDPAVLRGRLRHADHMRRTRAVALGAGLTIAGMLGFGALDGGVASTVIDTVDSPQLDPTPEPTLPVIGDADADQSTTTAPPTTTTPSTTAAPSTTVVLLTDTTPDHLTPPEATVAPTTSAPPTTVPATTAPPTTNPPTTTVVDVAFSATFAYGSCELDPPYDEYSGTAAPGATITITSPYSAPATTTVDGSGHWFRRVEFPTAPRGESFTVSITDGGAATTFSFVAT